MALQKVILPTAGHTKHFHTVGKESFKNMLPKSGKTLFDN